MGYFYIAGCLLFTVYGQIILKWRSSKFGELPSEFIDKLYFLIKLVFDPFVFSGFIAAFIASLFWLAAMTKFDISFAYPFMSLAFVLVFLLSVILFGETASWQKIVGLILIVSGVIISSRSP